MRNSLNELEKTLEKYFVQKAPKMPQDVQNIIVNFGPWLILLFIVLSIPSVIGILSTGALLAPFGHIAGRTAGVFITISWIFTIAILALEAFALPGLFKKEMRSWRFMLYATELSIVQSVLLSNILGAIVAGLIGFYVLFQIKHNYS